MHQLTDLPDELDQLPGYWERNDRIRTEGTRNLVDAAQAAGASRLNGTDADGWTVREAERMLQQLTGADSRMITAQRQPVCSAAIQVSPFARSSRE